MDKEINIDLIIGKDPFDPKNDIINRITTKVTETQDEFIFETISNWWIHNTQRYITKKELADALTKQKPVKPGLAKKEDEFYWQCGSCFKSMRGFDYCPHCGQKVDWDNDERT